MIDSAEPATVRRGPALHVIVAASDTGAGSVRPVWIANLLAGAFNDRLYQAGFSRLSELSIDLLLPGGELVDAGGGLGYVVPGQQFALTAEGVLAAHIEQGLSELGLTAESISFIRPVQRAPIVVAETPAPAAFVHAAMDLATWRTIFGDYSDLEGFYLEVADTQGNPVLIQAESGRVGGGLGWVRPDLELDRSSLGSTVGDIGWGPGP
ncbi:MAG: hypothetical protein ABR521_00750 [Gaiellaceae bacterium]